MRWMTGFALIAAVSACTDAQLRERWYVGERDGQAEYAFTTERDAALATPDSLSASIAAKAARVCPENSPYKVLSQSAPRNSERRYTYPIGSPPNQIWMSGSNPVVLVDVHILCPKVNTKT